MTSAAEPNQNQTINLSKIECIPPKNTISTINQFLLNTTDFINRFAYFSEEKLLYLDENVERLETQLILLEKKLETIPAEYFSNINTQISAPVSQPQPQPQTQTQPTSNAISIPPPPNISNIIQNSGALPPPPLNLLLAGGGQKTNLPPLPPLNNANNNNNNINNSNNNNAEQNLQSQAEEVKQEENKNELPGNIYIKFEIKVFWE